MESVWFATHPAAKPSAQEFPAGAHVDTVIAGAGLAGLSTAVLLARAGQKVVVLEARHVGAVTTGNTTAKVSMLQGLTLSEIQRHQPDEVLRAYIEANREGKAFLLRFLDERSVTYQRRTAYTYAVTQAGAKRLNTELDASRAAGLEVEWTTDTELPFPVEGALTLPDQAQIHPLQVLDALVAELADRGGMVIEGARVTDATTGSLVTITTTRGTMTADRLVLATGIPVLDRGGYFAKLVPQRSYATAHRVPGPSASIPQGMYLSVDDVTRSLRTLPLGDEELLIVGGNGHVAGRQTPTSKAVADLTTWTQEHFPGSEPLYAWSAQDYQSFDRIPFVGLLPRGGGKIYVATGFNKWGMANAAAAALNLSAQMLGGSLPWADVLNRHTLTPADVPSAVAPNLQVGYEMAKGWIQAELHPLRDEAPAEGVGVVGRGAGGLPEAVSTVAGVTCRLSGICSHLGGILGWNDAERSWDCPLHGSRFAADGTLLEGPAVTDLARMSGGRSAS